MDCVQSVLRRVAALTPFFLLTFALATALQVHAQVAGTASIQGSVSDPSGAVLPNSTIVLTNTSTQVQRTTTTDNSGLYSFPNIDIGTYNMTVTAQGFQTYTRTGIVLEVGSNTAINVPMKVGAADVKIEVQSEGLALQTEDASFKQTIDQNAVTEMPLNGRQMTGLITLSGGSSPAPGGDFTGSKYSYAAISVSIAGGMGNTTEWRLDGGDDNDWMANTNLPFPFPDAVTQFSVESTAMGSQSGSHSGGLVNVVTRSGTNQFHGSGFEFLRNNYMNARNFFSTRDALHQNQYGFTFGGPVWLPHIYNGHDKLFFFTGYQFQRTTSSSAATNAYVPTAANLAGDFSVTDPVSTPPAGAVVCGGVEQLYDPLTGAALPGNKYPSAPKWDPAALKLLSYLPKIVPLADGTDQCGHVVYAIPNLINDKQFVTRVDYTISQKHNLYGRYFLDGYQSPAPFSPTNILVTTQSGNIERVQNFTMGENWTISSKMVNTIHATISRRVNNRGYNAADINLATLGVKAFQLIPNGLQLTVSTASKNHGFTIGGGTNSVAHFNDNAFSISDDLTWVKGKHQLVMGGEFLRNQLNISNGYESNGTGTFNGFYSSNGPTGTGACTSAGKPSQCSAGDANLDFLAGAESGFEQSKQQQNALRAPIPSLYIQDTFHANSRVTVVGGIRWVPEFYPYDYFGRGSVFNYSAFLANKVSSVYTNAPAGAFFYGDAGVPKSFTKSSPWQFAPNVGMSVDPTGSGKTVLRGGFELAYDQVNFFTAQRNEQNPPNATASKPTSTNMICFSEPWLVGTGGFGCNQTNATDISPYPTPQIPTPATAIFPQQSQYIFVTPQFKASRTVQWTASVQHDFPHGWQLQLQYIGNHTYHAPTGYPLDNAVFIPGVWGANGTGCDPIAKTGPAAVKAGAAGTPCSTTANAASRFALTIANPLQGNAYAGGGSATTLVGDWGTANYNGLVSTLQHRLSNSFSLLTNYTYSKCLNINDASGDYAGTSVSDPNNYARDYGPCGSDYTHIENVVLIAKSNFGFGNRLERYLINGWEFAPLAHILSGSVINVTQGSDESLTSNGNDRPNVVPGVPVYLNTAIRFASSASTRAYLNPLAFVNNAAQGTFGTVSRNGYRGKPFYQFDAQISRIFPIHERLALDLRLEAFNVLNHPNFKNPSASNPGNPGSPNVTFGQITSANDPRIFQAAAKITF
ncbi:MAG TPA: carboxypeptidase-like regulatory domain-containing protein [Acidobacteriaceae bacterium]|jgi:hypothetical protein|nr:carboxypeptidase-like regulatory domain-containing protein [Acidobacteriaceae bacterium]